MKKFIFIFAVLFGCGILSMQAADKKEKIHWTNQNNQIPSPTGQSGNPIPVMDGEYDADSLTISISDYWGDAEVTITRLPFHQLMDSAEDTVVSEAQFDFSLSGYVEGMVYQVVVVLDNNETYIGEFVL